MAGGIGGPAGGRDPLPGIRPFRQTPHERSREVRGLLARCLMPTQDVFLSKIRTGESEERFFVAAFGDEKGASVLADRIRDQAERLPEATRTSMSLSVHFTLLKPSPPQAGISIENIVTTMAAKLEESIKSQTPEAIYHE